VLTHAMIIRESSGPPPGTKNANKGNAARRA
jgi:hypothetical protein